VHDPDYRTAQKDWASFVESLTQKIIEVDETVPELPVKDVVSQRSTNAILISCELIQSKIFRIYRDVRFSSDPTPYKVRNPSNELRICGVLTTTRQHSRLLGHVLVGKVTTLHITCRLSLVMGALSVSNPL
jgi:hypothetical protein